MAVEMQLQSQLNLKIGGSQVRPELIHDVIEAVVEMNLHLPDMFIIRFADHDLAHMNDTSMFDIGKEVEIFMGVTAQLDSLMKGEITAIEPDIHHEGNTLVIRGYDRSHRLHRGRQIKTYLQMKDSDIVTQIAGTAGLSPQVTATQGSHEYVIQHNQSNLEFCQYLAARNGYTCFVRDKDLYFQPASAESQNAPPLTYGESLVKFQPRMTSHEQVNEVTVRGWDPKSKQAITGTASSANQAGQGQPEIGAATPGGQVADSSFGTQKLLVVGQPVRNMDEATNMAQSLRNELAASYIQVEGQCKGNPAYRPGVKVEVKNIGARFSGTYRLTGTTHIYNHVVDYMVYFTSSSPRQPDTFSGLINSGGGSGGGGHEAIHAVAMGIVTNNKDDDNQGRVKVKFPWLSEQEESHWARLVSPGAGKDRGLMYIPEVNDEVLVAFDRGNVNFPYIIGGLWNGTDSPAVSASDAIGGDGKVNKRVIKSRSGHVVTLDDTDGSEKITMVDKTGNNKVEIHSSDNTLLAEVQGDITLESKTGKVTIKAAQDVSIESTSANCKIQAGQEASVKANTNLTLDGAMEAKLHGLQVEVNGDTSAKLHSLSTEVSGDVTTKVSGTMLQLEGTAEASLKAAIVMIN